MSQENMKDVLLRLDRLEKKVGGASTGNLVSKLTPEEISAYHKVETALWEDGGCGINETSPCIFKCHVVQGGKVVTLPKPCINECTCGPCNVYGPMISAMSRFRELGRY